MTKAINITGIRKGMLVALEPAFSAPGGMRWKAVCDCGGECIVIAAGYKRGSYVSCGCKGVKLESRPKINDKFGKWTVISEVTHFKKKSYLCLCECGNESTIGLTDLMKGRSRQCVPCGIKVNYVDENRLAKSVYTYYQNNANKKNREFSLTFNKFLEITQMNCAYCNLAPSGTARPSSVNNTVVFIYSGLDRIFNDRGYTEDNVAPCCATCNRMKGSMEYDDWKNWLLRIGKIYGSGLT